MGHYRPRINLILDFDGTITTEDTTAIIGSRCLAKSRELAPSGLGEDQLPKPMQYYSDKYMQEYQEWKTSLAGQAEVTTLNDEVLRLSQSEHVEQDSFMRVRNAILDIAGIADKLQQDEAARNDFMTDAGRQAVRSGELQIRNPDSLRRLISKVQTNDNAWGIVSVSWSRRFILGVLLESGLVKEGTTSVTKQIKSNELLAPAHADEDGEPRVICSAQDKLEAFRQLLGECGVRSTDNLSDSAESDEVLNIYVGDSSTDLGCLADVDVGMYISQREPNEDSVLQTLDRLSVRVLRSADLPTSNVSSELSKMKANLEEEARPPSIICAISGFDELDEWLSRALSGEG